MPRPHRPERPVVVLADLEPWDSLLQLGAALRRGGVDVTGALGALGAGGSAAPVVVEAVDRVAAALVASPRRARAALPGRLRGGCDAAVLYDKLAMSRCARDLGVAVPDAWAEPAGAVAHLPAMVKARLGSGGQDVRPVADEGALHRAWAELSAGPGGAFVERLMPGELVQVSGVARRGEVLAVGAYRSVAVPAHGPANSIELVDDDVRDVAGVLAAAGGYTGAFCLDLVRDAGGTARVIDVNARVFGSWMALQAAGVDVLGAYWRAHDLPGRPPGPAATGPRYGAVVPVRPGPADSLARGWSVLAAYRPWLGTRWLVAAGAEWAVRVGLRRLRAARGGVSARPTA